MITGAGGDIGRELAIRLSRRAGHLALVDHDPDRLDATVRACGDAAGAVSSWPVDVSAFDAVTQLADDIRANVAPVHALDNLAGVIHAGLLADSQMADLDRVIRVDLLGTMACSRAFLPQLVACGHGQLVTVSSAFGLMAVPGYAAYAAAKFGVPGFTEALQQELHPANVAVSAVYPGGIRTGIMQRGTYASSADPEEIQHRFDNSIARTSAATAATRILHGVERGERRIVIGPDAGSSMRSSVSPEATTSGSAAEWGCGTTRTEAIEMANRWLLVETFGGRPGPQPHRSWGDAEEDDPPRHRARQRSQPRPRQGRRHPVGHDRITSRAAG